MQVDQKLLTWKNRGSSGILREPVGFFYRESTRPAGQMVEQSFRRRSAPVRSLSLTFSGSAEGSSDFIAQYLTVLSVAHKYLTPYARCVAPPPRPPALHVRQWTPPSFATMDAQVFTAVSGWGLWRLAAGCIVAVIAAQMPTPLGHWMLARFAFFLPTCAGRVSRRRVAEDAARCRPARIRLS